MLIKQLSIFVENKKGRMAEITGTLASHGIDIRALSIADTTDYGILRLIVDDPERAVLVLKEEHMTVSLTDVIAIAVPDVPAVSAARWRFWRPRGLILNICMHLSTPRTIRLL